MNSPQSIPDDRKTKNENSLANDSTEVENGDSASETPNLPESSSGENTKTANFEEKGDAPSTVPAASSSPNKNSVSPSSAPVHTRTSNDPNKLTLKFIFANRDGLNVILDCKSSDTVGEVKGALLSVWPEDMPECSGSDRLRLICMGKGILMPDTKTLEAAEVPVFKTHPTPVNVSVKPEFGDDGSGKGSPKKHKAGVGGSREGSGPGGGGGSSNSDGNHAARGSTSVSSGCSCIIL